MTLAEFARAKLIASSAVTSLVAQRIYPSIAPQGAERPYVIMAVISDVPFNSYTNDPAGTTAQGQLQVDCYADRYDLSQQVADAVRDVLGEHGYLVNRADLYEDQAPRYRVLLEFSLVH